MIIMINVHVFNIACRISEREMIGRGFGESDKVNNFNVTLLSGEIDICLAGASVPLSI